MTQLLAGIRVIDWTTWVAGPMTGSMLGNLGADVVKIEQRLLGDPARTRKAPGGGDRAIGGERNFMFECHNWNKRSVALNLSHKQGREIVYRMVEGADVFVQNVRPGVAERLGLDYRTLSRHNPRLIYASVSGFGLVGPDKSRPGFDYLAMARSGFMTEIEGLQTRPHAVGLGLADEIAAALLAYGILAALLARERSGVAQQVDVSLLGSMIWAQSVSVNHFTMLRQERSKSDREEAANPLYNHYRCADGKWIALAMAQADRYWASLCRVLGTEKLEKDPRFENIDSRARHSAELVAVLDRVFATQDRAEWVRRLEAGGDFVFSILNNIPDLENDPQVVANDYIIDYEHPAIGKRMKMTGFPVRFSQTPSIIRMPAPGFGQHTEEVLLELGYTWEDIARFQEEEVI